MTYTSIQWVNALLADLGNPSPSVFVQNFLLAQIKFEGSWGDYNLLNTTLDLPQFNPFQGPNIQGPARAAGVRDFDTFEHGVGANAWVFEHSGNYPTLLAGLKGNNSALLQSTAAFAEIDLWGTHRGPAIVVMAMAGNPASLLPNATHPGNGPVPSPKPPGDVDTLMVKRIEDAFIAVDGAYAALKMLVLAAVEPKE